MGKEAKRAKTLAKVAIAKGNTALSNVDKKYTILYNRAGKLNAEHGISFNDDDEVIKDDILDNVGILIDFTGLETDRDDDDRLVKVRSKLEQKVDIILDALGITVKTNDDGDLEIDENGYADHTHTYMDNDGDSDNERHTEGVD